MRSRTVLAAAAWIALAGPIDWRDGQAPSVVGPVQAAAPPVAEGAKPFSRRFPAAGIEKVILRAEAAETAKVTTSMDAKTIDVAGVPTGGAAGYHSSDPNWRETPAAQWGLDFVSARKGSVLVVSTRNELRHIHHRYAFTSLTVRVPIGVAVVKERRQLTHDGAPDLR
jgi:hypothetical protein